jgi:F-type H+-transporting ATPase subunit epsilon
VTGLTLEVLTPETAVFQGEVDAVVAPLPDGWIGILPGHSPFIARLMRGQVAFRTGEQERVIATIGGSIAVKDDLVTLLTGAAGLDTTFDRLETTLGAEAEQIRAMEREAERHFDRVYRTLADTIHPRRRRRD